jgi:hypothetical protein
MPASEAIPVAEQLAILDELIANLDAEIRDKEQELAVAARALKVKMVKMSALEAASLPVLDHLTEAELTAELTIQRLKAEIEAAHRLLDAYDDQRDLLVMEEQGTLS